MRSNLINLRYLTRCHENKTRRENGSRADTRISIYILTVRDRCLHPALLLPNEMLFVHPRVMTRFHASRTKGDAAEEKSCGRCTIKCKCKRGPQSECRDRESPMRWIMMGARMIRNRAWAFGRKSFVTVEGARDAFDMAVTGSLVDALRIKDNHHAPGDKGVRKRGARSATLRHPHPRFKALSQRLMALFGH